MILTDGMLLLHKKGGGVTAVDAKSGKNLWTFQKSPVIGTLAADARHVVVMVDDRIISLDRKTGVERWRSKPVPRPKKYSIRFTPNLIPIDDVVLFAGGEKSNAHTDHNGNYSWKIGIDDTLTGMKADTGEVLWTAKHPLSGYASSEDLFVIDGVAWFGETTSGHAKGTVTGVNIKTGKVIKKFDPDVETYWFHHRCYRGKATEKYLITSRTGIEFIDPKTGHWDINHWTRGACVYGVLPANGLIYAPQHPCACVPEAKVRGLTAMAATQAPIQGNGSRLEKGLAYGSTKSAEAQADQWPTFRGNNRRSGAVAKTIPAKVKPGWSIELGGKLTALTISGGRLFTADTTRYQVIAIDGDKGKVLWRYTAGGRVDSPPTIHAGLAIFGSRDGYITALRAADGVLAWRFCVAPADRRMVAFDQLESVWPVHGSVLIHNNELYAVAGRSSFLDGGLRFIRLNATTGALVSESQLGSKDKDGKDLQSYTRQHNIPVALPDILSWDGKRLYMRSQALSLDGERINLKALPYKGNPQHYTVPNNQNPEYAHLFSPTGFLDDSWWHRTYWIYGDRFLGGWAGYPKAGLAAPGGRIMVFDEENVFAFGRKWKYYRWTQAIEHHLFSAKKIGFTLPFPRNRQSPAEKKKAYASFHWSRELQMFPRGMVKAGDVLFIAGPEDFIPEHQALRYRRKSEWKEKNRLQAEAFAGKSGGFMKAIDTKTGKELIALKLTSVPVFDGMAVGGGKLYMATVDGKVMQFE